MGGNRVVIFAGLQDVPTTKTHQSRSSCNGNNSNRNNDVARFLKNKLTFHYLALSQRKKSSDECISKVVIVSYTMNSASLEAWY